MIQYKVSSKKLTIGQHKGKVGYYAQAIPQDKITAHQVEERIEQMTALSRADVRSALTALAQIVRDEMFSGRTVDLADLGSFKCLSTGKVVLSEKEVTAETLKTPRIQFFPRHEMREHAKKVSREVIRDAGNGKRSGSSGVGSGASGEGSPTRDAERPDSGRTGL